MSDRRNKLEDLAQQVVQQNGLKGLSFRTLADEIGIKSSSVHYYFPEKSDLAQALIARYSETIFERLEAIAKNPNTLQKKVLAFIAIFEQVAKDEKLCMCGMMAAEVESLSTANRDALSDFFSGMERWLTSQLVEHAEELSSQLSPTKLAKILISGLEGALLVDRVAGTNQRLKAQKELFLSWLV